MVNTEILHQQGTMCDFWDHATRRYEDKVFLVSNQGSELTYGRLRAEIAATANAFRALNLGHGNGIGLLSANSPETLITREAANAAGLFFVALNPLTPVKSHVEAIERTGLRAVFVDDREFPDRLLALREALPDLPVYGFGQRGDGSEYSKLAEPYLGADLRIDARPEDISRMALTGGTTGRSKLVILRHRSFVLSFLMCRASWDLPKTIRFISTTPLSHASANFLTQTALSGGTFFMLDRFTPERFEQAVRDHDINCTFLVPTQMQRILRAPKIDAAVIASLETVMYGASPVAPSVLMEWLTRFGSNLCQLYGQAESPMCLSTLPKGMHDLARPQLLASCGLPNIGVQLRILRSDGSEADIGERGEICSRNPCIMDSYLDAPEETSSAFKHGWLHTGDLGYKDEGGVFYIVGRAKDMVISGGFNIYPREIEDILNQHPSVEGVAVFGVPDEIWGEALKAVVVLKPTHDVTEDQLIGMVRELKGPVYAPKSVDFVDQIPLTSLGKPDKNALRAQYWVGHNRDVA